ncbi:SDR family oxidoreductase [Aliidiomarina sp. Khilg15.8]
MRVSVFGANGKIGRHVVTKLNQSAAHDVTALVRKKEQLQSFSEQGVNACLADLTDSVPALSASLEGTDAVVFTAGSGGDNGDDMTLRIDLDGAVKAMEAAEMAGVKRFVIVSALQAHNRDNWHPSIEPYYIAKHYADRELTRSNLDYTIVRPGLLTDDAATGQVEVAADITTGEIPREDVASVLVEVLDKPNAVNKQFDLVSGQTDIKGAVSQL